MSKSLYRSKAVRFSLSSPTVVARILAAFFLSATIATSSGAELKPEHGGSELADARGRDICEVAEEPSVLHYGVDRSDAAHHAVILKYRRKDHLQVVFLLKGAGEDTSGCVEGKPNWCGSGGCGRIEDLVDLSGRADYDRFSIQFKCHKKGKKMVEWGDIVGLADSHEGRIRYVTPILAWYVDLLDGRFVAIDAKAVTCDTTGFES